MRRKVVFVDGEGVGKFRMAGFKPNCLIFQNGKLLTPETEYKIEKGYLVFVNGTQVGDEIQIVEN